MKVYKLSYKRPVKTGVTSTLLIGFFDSEKIALEVKKEYLQKQGFSEFGDHFVVDEYELDLNTAKLFYVQSEYYDSKTMCDIITEIGLFDSKTDAETAAAKKKRKNEICSIDTYELNEKNWQEGFAVD